MFPTVRLLLAASFTAIILIGGAMAQNSKASDFPKFFPYEVKTKTLANDHRHSYT
jgi:hypothetical protein